MAKHRILADEHPELLDEWDFEKNKDICSPYEVSSVSQKRVFWIGKCSHVWQTRISHRVNGNNCPYCSNKKVLKGFNDLDTVFPDIANEWNYDKNNELTPSDVTYGSNKKVWWKCSNCSYVWEAAVTSRTRLSTKCPKCTKRLQSSFPEQSMYYYILKCFPDAINSYRSEWLDKYTLDIFIPSLRVGIEYDGVHWHKSEEALSKDRKKYELLHSNDINLIRVVEFEPHCKDYYDFVIIRDNNLKRSLDDCIRSLLMLLGANISFEINSKNDELKIIESYYSNLNKNSLDSKFPEKVKDWDYEKNNNLTPKMFSPGSGRKVYWKCDKGHSYLMSVRDKCKLNFSCPYCSNHRILVGFNDLESKFPEVARYWDYKNNLKLPSEVLYGSHTKYYWICPTCGKSYKSSVRDRINAQYGCVECRRKRRK